MLMNIYGNLFIMSIIFGGLYLILKLLSRITLGFFSAKWHYYSYVFLNTFFVIPYYTLLSRVDLSFISRADKGLALFPSDAGLNILPSINLTAEKFAALPSESDTIYAYFEQLPYFLILGTLICVIIIFVQNVKLNQRIFKTCRLANDKLAMDTFLNCKEELGISQKIPVYISSCISTPFFSGIFKPRIILPDAKFHPEELRCIFLHELTHLKHHDPLIKCLMVFINSVHWFNPLAYMARRDIDRFCELYCDESLVKSMNVKEKKQYCELILSVLWNVADHNTKLSSAFSDKRKHLERRINMILKNDASKKQKWVGIFAITMTLTLALVGTVTAYAANENYAGRSSDVVELVKAEDENIKQEQPSEKDDSFLNNDQDSQNRSVSDGQLQIVDETILDFDIKAVFTIEHSNLAPNRYTTSNSSYYIDSGEELQFNATWSPAGQRIQIGLVSRSDSKQYWSPSFSNGNASGTLGTSDVPSGDYYVAIGTPSSNTENINVIGNFEWQ